MISASKALTLLREGNDRFVRNEFDQNVHDLRSPCENFTVNQHPHTIVVGCSDSRAPAELIFDQGIGDLFVVRVAGNIIAPSQLGSVEFAAAEFGTRLVVVLGHTHCGAIKATVDSLQQPGVKNTENVASIVARIQPGIAELVNADDGGDDAKLHYLAMCANVRAGVHQVRTESPQLASLIESDGLRIVGAHYDIENGEVEFFDGVPLQ